MGTSRDLAQDQGLSARLKYLADLANDLAELRKGLLNIALSDAGIAIGTTPQKVKTAATFLYKIDGVFYSLSATDDFWTLSGTTIPDGYYQKYLLLVDSAGAASILEGQYADTAAGVKLPALPDSKCVVGILTVATAAATFVPGTTSLAAATVTDTYEDGFPPSKLAGRTVV